MADRPVDFVSELNAIANEIMESYKQAWANEGYKPQPFTHQVIYNGQVFELRVQVPSYWKFVEYGTKAHEIDFQKRRPIMRKGKQVGELMGPPISVLKDWLSIKKGVPAGEDLKKAIMIDKKIAKNNGRMIKHPGSKGKELFESVISTNDYINRMCMEITRLMNVEVSQGIVSVFDGLKYITVK